MAQRDTYNVLLDNGVGPEIDRSSLHLVNFHSSSVLLLAAWVLEILVDTPAKKFSNEIDIF